MSQFDGSQNLACMFVPIFKDERSYSINVLFSMKSRWIHASNWRKSHEQMAAEIVVNEIGYTTLGSLHKALIYSMLVPFALFIQRLCFTVKSVHFNYGYDHHLHFKCNTCDRGKCSRGNYKWYLYEFTMYRFDFFLQAATNHDFLISLFCTRETCFFFSREMLPVEITKNEF